MKQKLIRAFSALLCALLLFSAVPALAIPSSGTVASGTPIYVGASEAQSLGTLSYGQVQILSQSGNFYQISVGGTTGYVLISAITPESSAATTTTTTNNTTTQTTSGAAAGYITNCESNVNIRSSASKDSSKLGSVNKNEAVSIIQVEGDYTKITTSSGVTGYVLSKYVASGTPSAGGASAAAGADTTMLENAMPMVSISKTIYIRKSTDTSTKSKNLVKKISSAKGKVFTVLGTVGSSQYYVTYDAYTGYVQAADFTTASSTGVQASYATGDKSKDKWGEIVKIDGTNIGSAYGKLYDNSIYCNGLNSKNQYYYNSYSGKKNYFYMLSPQGAPIAVLMSHNMQSSKTGGHYLHHIQNAWLGVAKCEKCKESCNSKTSVFNISYEKHTQWQLIGFYEGNESMRNFAAVNYGLTGSAKQGFIEKFLSYCNSSYKGAALGTAADTDDIMTFITCGDKGSKGGTYLCMLLKGI